MILLVFNGRSFGNYSFRSHQLCRQDLQMVRRSELCNLHNATTFTALWPTIFKDNFFLPR
jgi:hypothetical protein